MADKFDATIITGSLDGKELENSIDALVKNVSDKTEKMANGFVQSIDKMKLAMKDFALTQKVSVDLMKEAWRNMSSSFDAMVAAQTNATSGGSGKGGSKVFAPNTVGELEQSINALKLQRKELELNSDELRRQNAELERRKNLLSQQTKGVATQRLESATNMSSSNLPDAERKLRLLEILQRRYANTTELSVAQQNKLARAIQQTKDQIDRIKPKSLRDVLGMDENGIDAITKKMRELRRVQIDPNNVSQAKQLGDEYSRLKRRLAELQGQNIQATHANNYLAQSFGYIRNRVVYALTLGAMMQFVKNVYEIRSQYELLERSLGVLVNSFENGSRIFQELNNMALESPFTTMELAGAAKQLTAYNFAAKEVVDTTRRLADISSALGVPMERLTYNLGQIRAQTVLTARDARDFANAGLPIVASLAEHFSELEGRVVTTGDVYNRMSKKMVSYNDVMSVLNKMTDEGGKFFEFQAKQAETLKVQINNLDLAANNFFNEFGKANQSFLAAPIQGLKLLLQNWKSIDRVLQSIAVTFGVWKLAQVVAIKQQWAWASACGATAKQMGSVASAFASVGKALKALALNPWTWVFVGIMAVTDLINQFRQAKQAMHELNEEIRNNAKEASDSNLKFLDNKGNQSAYNLAKQNKLTAIDGERAWAKNKEQIEQSAMSANSLVAELSAIPDINERVAKSFEYISSIQQAQAALQDLKDDTIKVSTDAGWFGMFGEGLVSDLKDYAQSIEITTTIIKNRDWWSDAQKQNALTNILGVGDVKTQRQEFLDELENTAQSINSFIVAHKITDPLQINEIYKRAVVTIKTKNPEIKGELASLFDFELDKRMSQLTKGAIDENASLWDMFMERLKHNSSGAFQDINDDWANSNKKLSAEQKKAIDDNLKYFKDSMPEAYNAVAAMVADASKLRIQIALTFSKGSLTDFQKEVNKRKDKASSLLDFGSDALLPNSNEILHSWTKRMQDDIVAFKEENKNYQRDVDALEKKNTKQNQEKIAWSKQHIADNDRQIQQRKNLLDLFNQQYEKEKKGRKGSQKDLVLEALKNEIDLIKKAQSEYEKLTKDGASANDALATLNGAFGKTVTLLNSRLASYGLPLLDLKNVVKGNPKETLAFLEKISKALTDRGLSNLERMKVVEVAIEEFKLKVKSFDLKEITKGFEDAIKRLKGEFELAMQLDENPELGNMFANMLGVNIETLPRTISAYETAYTKLINKFLKDKNANIELPHLDLTNDDLRAFEEMKKGGALTEEAYEKISQAVNDVRDKKKKDFDETRKEYEALIKKYGEYEAKIKEVRNTTDKERLAFAKKFGSQKQADKATSLITNIQIANSAEEKEKLRNQLKELVADIARGDDTKIRLQTSIDMKSLQEEARINFEEYQKTPEWVLATGNISDLTHNALSKLIADLEQYKKKAKYLDDKQIKKINNALISLHKQIRKDNPFLAMGDSMDEACERMSLFQPELDTIMKQIVDLEKEIGDGEGTDKQLKKLADLKKRWEEVYNQQQAYGKVAATTIVKNINSAISVAKQASSAFNEMAEALGGKGMTEAAQTIKDVTGILEKGGEGAAAGAQIGGGYGAIIGAAAGVLQGVITTFADRWSGNAAITEKIVESQREVKKLTMLYKQLENAIEDAYGQGEMRAQALLVENKKLQLAELEHQLTLERSRKSKNRDEDKIIELQEQVDNAKQELKELADGITESFLGISSVKDAVSSMVDGIVDALKNGENAMDSFNESWEDMVWNMIKQVISTEILAPKFKKIFDSINNEVQERNKDGNAEILKRKQFMKDVETDSDRYYFYVDPTTGEIEAFNRKDVNGYKNLTFKSGYQSRTKFLQESTYDDWVAQENKRINELLDNAERWTVDDIKKYAQELYGLKGDYESAVDVTEEVARELGLTLGDRTKSLSNLTQGISSITESTANALEAYLNIISQRIFEHGTVFYEIRDIISSWNMDAHLGVQSQMLFQLQNNYIIMQSMQSMMENWTIPSGQGIRVELMN